MDFSITPRNNKYFDPFNPTKKRTKRPPRPPISVEEAFRELKPLSIVPRTSWGALPPTSEPLDLEMPVRYVVLTETSSRQCENHKQCSRILRKLQKYYIDNVQRYDIPFNFMVGPKGRVYEGRGWFKNGIPFQQPPQYDPYEDEVWGDVKGFKAVVKEYKRMLDERNPQQFNREEEKRKEEREAEWLDEQKKKDYNNFYRKSISIAMITNFYQSKIYTPLLRTAFDLIHHGVKNRYISKKYKITLEASPNIVDLLRGTPFKSTTVSELKKKERMECGKAFLEWANSFS